MLFLLIFYHLSYRCCYFISVAFHIKTKHVILSKNRNGLFLLSRFHIKVTAVWGKGSNADVALDDIALGAACFETGRLLLTCHHKLLQTITETPPFKYD